MLVEIVHDLRFRVPALAPVADRDYRRFLHPSHCGRNPASYENPSRNAGLNQSDAKRERTPRGHHWDRSDHLHRNRTRGFLARNSRGEKRYPAASPASIPPHFTRTAAGEIRDWIPEDHFPPHRLKRLDRYAQFAVASAKMALDDAGIAYSRETPQASRRREFRHGSGRNRERRRSARAFPEEGNARRESDARASGLWRLGAFEHCDRVRLSRRRHDELEQLRQRHGRGRRSASLHSR